MPKVRIMFVDNAINPMSYGGNQEDVDLEEFDYLPKIGETVYLKSDDLFYKVVNVIHEPKRPNSKAQKWATVIILDHLSDFSRRVKSQIST